MVDLERLRDQGEAAWGAGHWEPARAAYAAIVEREPADEVASLRWVECLLALGPPEEAMRVVEELLDRLEQRSDLCGALAIAESLLKLPVSPVLPLERAIRLHFQLGDSSAGLARLRQLSDWYLEQGRTDLAIEVLKKAQHAYPACVDIGMELGSLYIALGFVDEGTEQFRQLGHRTLDFNVEEAMEAFRRWDFLKRLNDASR
jgi:tetratricopeptide (TPR) repeat protein